MIKNAYFILKALSVLEIFTFSSRLFGYVEKRPDKIAYVKNARDLSWKLISKFTTWQTGQQIITIRTLPNISSGKGNGTIKFGQLIEYKTRNIFFEKSHTKRGEASPRPFKKIKIEHISGSTVWNVI